MAWIERYTIPFTTTPYEFHLHGFCDLQIGSTSTSMSVIKRRIKEIIDDPFDSGIIIPGDIEDEDRPSTRALRKSTFADREEVIYRDAEKHRAWIDKTIIPLLLPLHTKTKYGIMGILAGHHFTQLSPIQNSVEYICMELGRLGKRPVPYLGQMLAYMDFRFRCGEKGIRIMGHIQHGEGGGQTKAASLAKIERTAQGFEGDFFIRAHDCQIIATKTPKLYPKETRTLSDVPELLDRMIVYLNLGAATRGYEIGKGTPSYIEQKVMRPTAMGWGTIKFKLYKALTIEDSDRNIKCDMRVEI